RHATDALDGCLDLLEVGHRLDPDQVDATGHERGGLLGEDVDRLVIVERAGRGEDRTARADIAGHEGIATRGVDRFQTSGGSPNIRPLAKSIVPIAPSATIVRLEATRSRQRWLAAPPSARSRSSRSGNAAGSNGSTSTDELCRTRRG